MGGGISLLEPRLSSPATASLRTPLYEVMRTLGIVSMLYFSDVSFPSKKSYCIFTSCGPSVCGTEKSNTS